MKLTEANVTILVSAEQITIEFKDGTSNTTFAKATLTPANFAAALGRLLNVKCEMEVRGLDRIGKKMEHKKHEFEVPDGVNYSNRNEILSKEILKTLPDGWVSDNYFNSQDTFFTRDGIKYAQTTIRRWV